MHYLSSDGQPGLHLLSRRGHHCAEDGERAYGAASQKFARRFRRPTDRATSRDLAYLATPQTTV